MPAATSPFARPYVVSWNLTYRCNLACEHCYLDAGGKPQVDTENFADRSELDTEECFRVIDEHRRVRARMPDHPDRRRAAAAARHPRDRPARGGARAVGRRRHQRRAHHGEPGAAPGGGRRARALAVARRARSRSSRPLQEGARRLAQHRRGRRRSSTATGLPFIVQTTAGSHNLGELEAIADFAHDRLAAKVWNLYFLVPTGRGQFVSDITPGAVRRGARLALPDPAEVRRPDAREREVRAALHQDGPGARRPRQADPIAADADAGESRGVLARRVPDPDLLGRGRRVPGGHALHGDPAERRRHARAPTSRSSRERFAARVSRTCGRPRSCSPTSAAAPSLGGRCGACEMNGHCGGCRARAYGMTGDLMAEDPLCTHTPGTFAGIPALLGAARPRRPPPGRPEPRALEYGRESPRRSRGTMRPRSG